MLSALPCLLALFLGLVWSAQASESEPLRLVPFPKSVQTGLGRLTWRASFQLQTSGTNAAALGRLLNAELQCAGWPRAAIQSQFSTSLSFQISSSGKELPKPAVPADPSPEAYALTITPQGLAAAARTEAGLALAMQTVGQLIRANRQGQTLPCLLIQDWPSLRWRAFQDDMTRGPSSTLATLQQEAELGASLKFNLMTYYMEYQFAFAQHPTIGPTNGSLTPADLAALVQFAQPLHLDILGNQQSFGHFSAILRHPEFAALRETPDILTPVREETYQLLDDLYSEVCPVLPFPWFNVCCDETDGLGRGPARELAGQIGVGGVYVRHIQRVHDLLRDRHQKRMMMWGDIILQHPDHLSQIPKDTIMLTWGYDARANFEDQIIPFARSGYEFFVCPGVNNWSRMLPDFGVAVTNIQNFVRDGAKHGALGMINTDWEDDGEALNFGKWYVDAWAAECAWNGSTTRLEDFQERVGAVLFGEKGDHFGQAIALLTPLHRLPGLKGLMNARFWEKDFAPQGRPELIQAQAHAILALVRPALRHLETCRREARVHQVILDTYLFEARRVERLAQRQLDGLRAAQLYEEATVARHPASRLKEIERLARANQQAHQALGQQFGRLWMGESKPYALAWTLQRYTNSVRYYENLHHSIAQARLAAKQGARLPSADEVGLAIPRPLLRLVKPKAVQTESLRPEVPWADSSSALRLGFLIRAGSVARFDLPVEVECRLPIEMARQPLRAFQLTDPQSPVEILVQYEPPRGAAQGRLVLLLPGPVSPDRPVPVQVYLGTRHGSALPTAVHASPGPAGLASLENDQVRLLVGGEGAHVYRWELKQRDNRDLTMPGETGWAGFADEGHLRTTTYQLQCTAAGPALVEYTCTEPGGQSKTIRLYGGVSWIEVFLNEPTPNYWDFDDPRNFAADGPSPGRWLFSNGLTGTVGREADGVPAQVKAGDVHWGIKFNTDGLALGLVTPETAAFHHLAPGAGAGGVGIEGSHPAAHFVTFGGLLTATPSETMERLQHTLDLRHPISVDRFGYQARPQP